MVSPGSKREFADWAQTTTLPSLLKFDSKAITSQHFWDQTDGITEQQLMACEDAITRHIFGLYNFKVDKLILDYTNYYSYIATSNPKSTLAKRGHNKQKRYDLRQYSLAVVTTKDVLFPMCSHVYEGNINDQTEFPVYLDTLQARVPDFDAQATTLVYDGGSNNKANLAKLKGMKPASDSGKLVGVTMPTKSLQRWNEDGANVKAALEEKGYTVDLQYADNKQDVQNSQIENQITMGCDVLVIASIDGGALGGVLKQAKDAGIPVIAYDRLITNTDKCDYYATFDNYGVGKMQGEFIVSALGLDQGEKGPFSLECFGGDPGDNNAGLFNQGAMDALQPYIDSGVLVVKSGQTKFPDQIAITNWESKGAQDRMDNLLTAYYADSNIDVVLSPNDSLAQGIVTSLLSAGYGSSSKPFPILTGQDCDKINVGQIIRGEQSMSIFKDTRILANQVIAMTDAILAGQEVPTNTTYHNGVIDVPSYNCEIQFANKDNWKELLVDSGYYTLSDIPGAE